MDKVRTERISRLHLDLVGGIAGDMFVASLLNAFPHYWNNCLASLSALNLNAAVGIASTNDMRHDIAGTIFTVTGCEAQTSHHAHVHWQEIRDNLQASHLSENVKAVACAIFTMLAGAEAAVHGTTIDKVAFHEVGAIDSIIDIVMAATLINELGNCIWSMGPLPLGRGLINSQHGKIPIPAPATTLLLEGFITVQDEEVGERITPTGAAILKFLNPTQNHDPIQRRLSGTGIGLGKKNLKARANMLRICVYEKVDDSRSLDFVALLRCEIDDQTGEDIAVALDQVRVAAGVRDVCQWSVIGKKGRMAVAVQVIVAPEQSDAVTKLLFEETCTLGVRCHIEERSLVKRESVEHDGVNLKLAHRSSGTTAKAEMVDLQAIKSHSARQEKRLLAETAVLKDLTDE